MNFMNTDWHSSKIKSKQSPKERYESHQDKFLKLLVKKGENECWYIDIGGSVKPLDKYCTYSWRNPEDNKNRNYTARKVAYQLLVGTEIPSDHVITTTCERAGCVNPNHLTLTIKSKLYKSK